MGSADVPGLAGEPSPVAFGDFRWDPARTEVTFKGRPVAMRPKAYSLLSFFLAHPGRTLTKQELMAALWPDVVVTEDSLVQCVTDLRAALGAEGAQLVITVPRRGYRFEGVLESVGPAEPATNAALKRNRWPVAVAAAAGLAALTMTAAWSLWRAPAVDADSALDRERSLAVLPLAPRDRRTSADFAEAMTEELIGDMARVPGTTVISGTSAATAAAQEKDVRRIGKLLDVAYVVTGSVAREDQAVEVALQFASTTTGAVLWSERWRGALDATAWRGDIPLRIARALDLQLTSAVYKAPARGLRPLAVAALARGDHLLRTSTAPADVLRARASYEEAIGSDPASARAWSGLALSYLSEIQSRWATDPARQAGLAAEAIHKALSIDADFAQAHYAQGHLRMVRGDPAGALASYERVVALNPSDAWAHARVAAALLALGRFDEVAAHVERARRLSPLESTQTSFGHVIAGGARFHKGDDEAAYAHFAAASRSNPNNATAWALMASIDAMNGRSGAATHALAKLKSLRPQATVSTFRQANASNGPLLREGDERFHAGLLKAGLEP